VEIARGVDMVGSYFNAQGPMPNAQCPIWPLWSIEHLALSIVPFFVRDRPRVFAHRGGCALGPENTIAAFDAGLAAGADGLELDVHLSADGEVVVFHDETLERTTGDSGPVAARTAAELARVDAGCRFVDASGARPYRGQGVGVPTLADVLRRYPDVPVIVEMKVDSAALGSALARVVRAAGAADRVCAAGYGPRSVAAARTALPEMASSASHPEVRLALYRSWAGWPVRRAPYGGYQVPEHAGWLRVVSRRFVRHAHAAGLQVAVWTVDEQADMERLLVWGVDGLITNRPDLAVQVRDAFVLGSG
jgi:glycerophosphoryl diester phosphodiesterase